MINATTTPRDGSLREETLLNVRPVAICRLNPRTFWLLLALQCVGLAAALVWVFSTLPAATPATVDLAPIQEAIRARLVGTVHDPLIEVRPGVTARESNLRGFHLGGTTYYYYLEGLANFDPLSRGAVSRSDVELLLRDQSGPNPLVIYTIHASSSSRNGR